MPTALKAIYSSYPGALYTSPWATQEGHGQAAVEDRLHRVRGHQPVQPDVVTGLKQQFAAAKKQGLVKGSLVTNIPATSPRRRPKSRSPRFSRWFARASTRSSCCRSTASSETPAIEAAGKAGVPVILADTPPAPGRSTPSSAWSQNQVEADAGALGLIKKGNILMVKGIAGNENDVVLYNQAIADLKNCPNIHVAATLYGNWDNGTAKTVVSQYLAAHPQPIAGAIQDGGMMAGVVSAFQSKGRHGPDDRRRRVLRRRPVVVAGAQVHVQDGRAAASTASRARYTYMNVALRVLANKGPKYNVLEMPARDDQQRQPVAVREEGAAVDLQRRDRRSGDGMVQQHLPGPLLQQVRVAAEIAIAAQHNAR